MNDIKMSNQKATLLQIGHSLESVSWAHKVDTQSSCHL